MLEAIGASSIDELFEDIPEGVRLGRALELPDGKPETEVYDRLSALASRNAHAEAETSFLGAGMYDHYVPAIVDAIIEPLRVPHAVHAVPARDLPGRAPGDVRVPDGDVGADRAAGLERRALRRPVGGRLRRVPGDRRDGPDEAGRLARRPPPQPRVARRPTAPATAPSWSRSRWTAASPTRQALAEAIDDETAAVFLQQPNFLGAVEDVEALGASAKENGALVIVACDPIALSILKPPGECGADIAVGEGQPLGNRLDYGGPSFGFFCATEEHIRRMPGRIAGETTDVDGRRGFVLTLQTREQHIRREKATHNICTAQALNALAGIVHLAWLGKRGFVELGELLARRTAYARERLGASTASSCCTTHPVVREFAVRLDAPVGRGARPLRGRGHRRRLPARPRLPRARERPPGRDHRAAQQGGHRPARRRARARRRGDCGRRRSPRGWRREQRPPVPSSPRPRCSATAPRRSTSARSRGAVRRPCRRRRARAPLDELIPKNLLRDQARGAAGGLRARDRPPLQPDLAAELRPRHGLLPARLVHDEAQPAPQRAGRGAARATRACTRRRSRSAPRARSS